MSRLKAEYNGGLVVMRRHDEAVMVGTDLAVMVVQVDGGQVRLWMSSKTQQPILVEKKYRENQEARRSEPEKKFHPFYKANGSYVLSASNNGEAVTKPVPGVTIARFDSLLEAESFAKGVKMIVSQVNVDIERQHRDAFVLIDKKNDEPFQFVDYSKL